VILLKKNGAKRSRDEGCGLTEPVSSELTGKEEDLQVSTDPEQTPRAGGRLACVHSRKLNCEAMVERWAVIEEGCTSQLGLLAVCFARGIG
jgi:hypothetical protein